MDCTVVVELRPMIGSCQFFVKMKKHTNVSNVVIDSNKIFIRGRRDENIGIINIGSLKIVEDSISGLQMTDFSLLFRIRIEPNKVYGSFKNEIIVKENVIMDNEENYRPEIAVGEEITVKCRQCLTPLAQPMTFSRVLPLPTNFDTSDFFCHGDSTISMKPKSGDCLYGLNYVQINSSLLPLYESSDKIITCHSCLTWLGVREKPFALFWNSSVIFKESDKDNLNIALNNFISVIKNLVRKDIIVVSKIVLYTKMSNNETHYLLIWVIENSLSLLMNEDRTASEILLKKHKVFKVLYTYETEVTDTVKNWEKGINCMQLQISKQMMTEGLAYMKVMSEKIPEQFRKANQMDVSYIMV